MAHAGKHYPLAFRRDLALDTLNNAIGYPIAYYWTISQCFGTIPPAVGPTTVMLISRDDWRPNESLFVSDVVRVAGRDLTVQLDVGSLYQYPDSPGWVRVFDRVRGELVVGTCPSTHGHTYQGIHSDVRPGANYTPSLIQTLGNISRMDLQAVPWAAWNLL